jgi:GNAT superfamily N-acetyltransferase
LRIGIHDNHGVRAIFVALSAVVFDRLAGAVLAKRVHRARSILLVFGRPAVPVTLNPSMTYTIRPATMADIPHIVSHRAQMFRDMGIPAQFEDMATATDLWLRQAVPAHTYRGWMATAPGGDIAGGSGLLVIPWPPGPITLDPRCGFVFNVYTDPAHRKQGIARQLMEVMHDWCRNEGIERIVLNASTFGQSLYASMGYVVTDEPMMRLRLVKRPQT